MSDHNNQQEHQSVPENPLTTSALTAREPLPTIWEAPEALWEKLFLPLLSELDPPSPMGRPRADQRKCLDGMIYRARTGCQWNHLPKEFGSDSTVHRTVCRWDSKGVFDQLWALLIYHCEDLQAVHWEWQAADGCMNKARFIGKRGVKANRARQRKPVQKQPVQKQPVQKQPGQKQPGQKQPGQKQPGQKQPGQKQASKTVTLRAKGSVPTPPTVPGWASNRACLLRSEAARLLSASPELI